MGEKKEMGYVQISNDNVRDVLEYELQTVYEAGRGWAMVME